MSRGVCVVINSRVQRSLFTKVGGGLQNPRHTWTRHCGEGDGLADFPRLNPLPACRAVSPTPIPVASLVGRGLGPTWSLSGGGLPFLWPLIQSSRQVGTAPITHTGPPPKVIASPRSTPSPAPWHEAVAGTILQLLLPLEPPCWHYTHSTVQCHV